MISSHILDTHLGQPACNILVKLYNHNNNLLAEAYTNNDGRILASDFSLTHLQEGQYSLEFLTQPYYENLQLETFYPKVMIHFFIKNPQDHYHIPLLISPFAYSSYKGS